MCGGRSCTRDPTGLSVCGSCRHFRMVTILRWAIRPHSRESLSPCPSLLPAPPRLRGRTRVWLGGAGGAGQARWLSEEEIALGLGGSPSWSRSRGGGWAGTGSATTARLPHLLLDEKEGLREGRARPDPEGHAETNEGRLMVGDHPCPSCVVISREPAGRAQCPAGPGPLSPPGSRACSRAAGRETWGRELGSP